MTFRETETAPTVAEGEALLVAAERYIEFKAAEVAAADAFAAFWAGSASSSVCRDHNAGRVATIRADR